MYLFTSLSLTEIIFLIGYYSKTSYNKYKNKNKVINNLNRIMIALIFFNSIIFKFNLFSTIELKIFFDKNTKIINSIYLILSLYSVIYVAFSGINFCIKNKRKIK